MRLTRVAMAITTTACVVGGVATAGAAPVSPRLSFIRGLPAGVPSAALRPEPTLPRPKGWPFPDTFSRTSGTGRLAGGAAFWTDFVYDDHGAGGNNFGSGGPGSSGLAMQGGTYSYPAGTADGNGADIFRAAVGADRSGTYWRVDWVTLADRNIPIAEWTIDSDRSTSTGTDAWPANARVGSPGIDTAIVVSAKGATLRNLLTGSTVHLPVTVDMSAHSFVVRVPRRTWQPRGTSRVRLAAGLADATGTAFAPATGAQSGQPNVYNVTFRNVIQEPPQFDHGTVPGYLTSGNAQSITNIGNYWMDDDQAQTLSTGNVSKFSYDVDWNALQRRATTPEPLVYGYSARWYVTPLHLGAGVIPNASGTDDLRPNFLSPVQPYAVYVPRSYRPGEATPLTWMLHSLSVNYNQYGGYDPRLIQELCEDRHSICASPEGFGPDGWYFDEAEVDFWDVWRQMALGYSLDPTRTVISGYSMGGYGTYRLGMTYPDLFAGAMALAGPPDCGARVYGTTTAYVGPGACTTAGNTTPLVTNAKWLPYVTVDGAVDELVPVSGVIQQVQAFVDAGNRIHAEIYPAEDHLLFASQDGFDSAVAHVGTPLATANPPDITYTWHPDWTNRTFGVGPTGVYWLRDLQPVSSAAGSTARVSAVDSALTRRHISATSTEGADPTDNPTPVLTVDQTWVFGAAPATTQRLRLTLTGVASLSIDRGRAHLQHATAIVTTDHAVTIHLSGSRRVLHVATGTHTVTW